MVMQSIEESLDECIERVIIKKVAYGYEFNEWTVTRLSEAIEYCEDRNLLYDIVE